MKRYIQYALLTLAFVSCDNKPKKEINSYSEFEKPETTSEIQKQKHYHYSDTLSWHGHKYTYVIEREADDSLMRVKDDAGVVYDDNFIDLSITCDGTTFFNKRFTKGDFDLFLDSDFKKNAILEGMAFDKKTPSGLSFSASVSYPTTDLYIPILITVASNGEYSLEKDVNLDTDAIEDDSI